MIDEIELMAPLRPVVRKATQEDKLTLERNKEKEKKAFAICQEKIAQHGLTVCGSTSPTLRPSRRSSWRRWISWSTTPSWKASLW